jgi:hypothetical protein
MGIPRPLSVAQQRRMTRNMDFRRNGDYGMILGVTAASEQRQVELDNSTGSSPATQPYFTNWTFP